MTARASASMLEGAWTSSSSLVACRRAQANFPPAMEPMSAQNTSSSCSHPSFTGLTLRARLAAGSPLRRSAVPLERVLQLIEERPARATTAVDLQHGANDLVG